MKKSSNTLRFYRIMLAAGIFCLGGLAAFAQEADIANTKNKIQQLDHKISSLKKSLARAEDKRSFINQELVNNEKKISLDSVKLQKMQAAMAVNNKKITQIEGKKTELTQQLSSQQQLLAQHLRLRYQMGEYQPIKWVLNQDAVLALNRLFIFHQYLVRSRQNIIQEIDRTKEALLVNQNALSMESEKLKSLQDELQAHKSQLEDTKRYHQALIKTLHAEIQGKEQTLSEFEQNKKNLSKLLDTLSSQNVTYSRQPFTTMRRKLPNPVTALSAKPKAINQGLMFFAKAGSPVYAVYPGKIVFSDWLNGYGHLLILDHGQGFMTLYAYNQSFVKHKGDSVGAGTQIATVGRSAAMPESGLYFEVRQRGKAVAPSAWLSKSGI